MFKKYSLGLFIKKDCFSQKKGERTLSKEDIGLLKTAVSKCPSKQNVAFYKVHFILNPLTIKKIKSHIGFTNYTLQLDTSPPPPFIVKRPPISCFFVFEDIGLKNILNPKSLYDKGYRNDQINCKNITEKEIQILRKDQQQAIGVAGGYLSLTAKLLGYETVGNQIHSKNKIKDILSLQYPPLLILALQNQQI